MTILKAMDMRRYNSRPEVDSFFYLDNAAKFSDDKNNAANRSLVGAILNQAYDDFLFINKKELKRPCFNPSKRKKFIKNAHKEDRIETCIEFLDKENPLFIYYCHLIGFDPEWVITGIYRRIKDYYLNKADNYLKKRGIKGKKKIPLPVDNIDNRNLYCSDRVWKNVNNECSHGKTFYCEKCLRELPKLTKGVTALCQA